MKYHLTPLVHHLYQKIESIQTEKPANDILLFHSLTFKKTDDFVQAISLWEYLSEQSGREAFIANIELAKYFEHKGKDISKALQFAQKAEGSCCLSEPQKKQLEKRLFRLSQKSGS